jgi:uncharacterized protein YutE (UPF0331/DUF86 family)
VASLDELRDRLAQRPLTFIERSATERSLQIVIEAAVGASKHTLRAHGRPIPTEARTAIERVYEVTGLTTPALDEMRGAVGMRNAIVHDYLNLDGALTQPGGAAQPAGAATGPRQSAVRSATSSVHAAMATAGSTRAR